MINFALGNTAVCVCLAFARALFFYNVDSKVIAKVVTTWEFVSSAEKQYTKKISELIRRLDKTATTKSSKF